MGLWRERSCQFYRITMSGHALRRLDLWLRDRTTASARRLLCSGVVYSPMKRWLKLKTAFRGCRSVAAKELKCKVVTPAMHLYRHTDPPTPPQPLPGALLRSPSIVVNLSWCCLSTTCGSRWQQTTRGFTRGTLRCFWTGTGTRSYKRIEGEVCSFIVPFHTAHPCSVKLDFVCSFCTQITGFALRQ